MKFKTLALEGRALTKVALADSMFLRLRGLIGRDVEKLGGLWITPCGQIHMFFMSCPIDAVYLSRENTVLKVDAAVPTGVVCPPVKGARRVLELPSGAAEGFGIVPGTRLELRDRLT